SGSVQSIAVSVFQAHELSRILIGRYEDRKPQVTNRRGCTEAQTQTGDERRENGCWLCCEMPSEYLTSGHFGVRGPRIFAVCVWLPARVSTREPAAITNAAGCYLRTGMPAANQFRLAALLFDVRIRSIGLAQSVGGSGSSTSSILKSPLGASWIPVTVVLCSVIWSASWQISVATT